MISVSSRPIDAQASFTNALKNIYAMHQFVRQIAIEAGFSNVALGDIELAVVEACANIIKHAYRGVPEDTAKIDIHVTHDWGMLAITVTDWGAPFEPPTQRLAAPDVDVMVVEKRRGGMGIFFMQQMMDEVAWDIRPGVWNRVRLIKRLA
jgi:serine/threonine-protein kinase RsbW